MNFTPRFNGLENFDDLEILAFVGSYLGWIVRPTARYYYHARQIKEAGQDWQGWLLQQWFSD